MALAGWQRLIDQQLVVSNQCYEACILSRKNAVPWACSPGFIPRQYDALVTTDDGTEKQAQINEAAQLTDWIQNGTQPNNTHFLCDASSRWAREFY